MKTRILIFSCALLFFTACKKNKDNNSQTQETYLNTTEGSSWSYHESDSSGASAVASDYTVTSSAHDTSINSKSYHIYTFSYGGSKYLNVTGHNYYQFDSIPGGLGQVFERLYLKDDAQAGANWKQDLSVTIPGFPLPVPVSIANNVAEKGISRTVNGNNYTHVIHVTTSITSSYIPEADLTSAIDSYYAPGYGLIENKTKVNLNYLGMVENVNIETKLVSAVLK